MAKKIIVIVLVLGAFVGGLVLLLNQEQSQAGADFKPGAALNVVATSTMVADMVREIGGDRIAVHGIMGPKVDPHSFQVTSSASAALLKADLVFYSGLHLEGKMQDALEQRAAEKKDTFAVTDGIPEDQLLKPQEEFSGYHDPHVWGSPELWVNCLDVVVKQLAEADPEGADSYRENAERYRAEILELHRWAKDRMAEVPESQRVLVTSHDAFFYFGQAYGFEVRGLQGVSTSSEAGLKDRADLVAFIKERQLKTIFPESSVNAKGIKAVADEAGVAVSPHELFSDAMGEPGDVVELHGESYDKGTYIGMIKHNVNSIVDGLK
ncbi:zinc ABC transporter substrate-binding protein [Verrucomicrobiaceae bacterium 5K15]|uniref:Zinc ABC transporter substrate-binding protein n=1 Tax=Oceaniferula flava TaxID=2800421 RepID=A0AAE2SDM6_9BACT|nr:zinc ABC transporter substrate-binding protein [Oceaniferula flavus]MBK1855062.1 zinc ABC transporter substrate-binding protein [Oceaniferula flavus]MBM1136368.1 zinc ABC transporter substrate-binding protein [Oceaniferula flavus]